MIRVRVPASSANLGPGYDVFSVALKTPYLVVEAEKAEAARVEVANVGEYAGEVTDDTEKHAGARAARKLLSEKAPGRGVVLRVYVSIPPRKGLGLSGAEAAGSVYAVNYLYNLGLKDKELVYYAASAEPGGHLDNVSASLLGGFAIALYDSFLGRTVVRAVKPPEDLGFVVIVPDILKKSTEDARRAVPEGLSRHQHVETVGRAALATLALYASDLDLLLECVVYDPYVEMARAEAGVYGRGLNGELLTEEKRKIFQLYHVAETVSGAGPSRLLWYRFSENRGPEGERPIDKAVETVLDNLSSAGYRAHRIYHTGPSIHGCQIY